VTGSSGVTSFGLKSSGPSAIRHRGGSGEPLLLLHGFTSNAETWRPILPALERHHDVVAVTFHGHAGGPPMPAGFDHSMSASADLAEQELDAAGFERVHLVGNSLGGWLAIELARRGRALSMVAISPGGGWEPGSSEQRRIKRLFRRIRASLLIGGPLAPVLARFAASRKVALGEIVAHPERLSPAEARAMIEGAWRCDAFEGVMEGLTKEPAAPPFAGTPVPMRIVWGTRDRMLPIGRYSDRWRKMLPTADWVELHGAGHVPMFDDPAGVARVILEVTAPPKKT
jgi:pimeloyl-ACP methyl ester carboxylesterase